MFIIDTGINENPFQAHYFDMNPGHKAGKLLPMKIGDRLDGTDVEILVLKPMVSENEQTVVGGGDEL